MARSQGRVPGGNRAQGKGDEVAGTAAIANSLAVGSLCMSRLKWVGNSGI